MVSVLLVEDDKAIVDSLTEFLMKEDYKITAVPGQRKAQEVLRTERFDLVLLDISLKDGNGYSLCSEIKSEYDIPVIFLTASGDEASVVAGFDLGADDYIAKPFRPRELVSRIKNALRKYQHDNGRIVIGDLFIDTDSGRVSKGEKEIALSALEFRILQIFLENRGRILSREALLEDVWDIAGNFVNDNTLSVYIKRLREKIEDDPQNPKIIMTVRGLGYRMV
ncbi:MAG: response regulator transcription factor [Lachnospiraceae bacterium]|nr:response regulator transcription factor [Lachnospiraceae bacterium]